MSKDIDEMEKMLNDYLAICKNSNSRRNSSNLIFHDFFKEIQNRF